MAAAAKAARVSASSTSSGSRWWCGTQENKKGVLVGRTYPYFKSFVQRPADAGYARKLMAAGAFAYHYHLSSSAPKAGVHSLFDAFWEVMGGGDHASGGNATGRSPS